MAWISSSTRGVIPAWLSLLSTSNRSPCGQARLGHDDAVAVPINELDAKLLFKSLYLPT
jgi:hypothetical protein